MQLNTRMVTEHDSRMIDLLVTNSKWVEDHAALGMLYSGKMLRTKVTMYRKQADKQAHSYDTENA